jgi:hypothetical protein
MTVSEIIKQLTPSAQRALAEIPGYPVKVGAPVRRDTARRYVADELKELGVVGPCGGLTVKGAAVADKIKAENEPF